MFRLWPPESNTRWWLEWRQKFLKSRIESTVSKEVGEIQLITLLSCMNTETKNDVQGLFIQKERREKEFWFIPDQIWNILIRKRYIIHGGNKFHRSVQKPTDSIEMIFRGLYEIAGHCEFPNKSHKIRQCFVLGLRNKKKSQGNARTYVRMNHRDSKQFWASQITNGREIELVDAIKCNNVALKPTVR